MRHVRAGPREHRPASFCSRNQVLPLFPHDDFRRDGSLLTVGRDDPARNDVVLTKP